MQEYMVEDQERKDVTKLDPSHIRAEDVGPLLIQT